MIERKIVVDTAAGPLNAVVAGPEGKPGPGLVLVNDSGAISRDDWGEMPGWLAGIGVATLRHDKPGCGGSPGDWRRQTFVDRAADALAAVATLRAEAAVTGVGLIGYGQGGWVSLLAATTAPRKIDFLVTISGPAVTVAEQERVRIERSLRRAGFGADLVDEALRWVDERAARLAVGDQPARVLADQHRLADRPWHDLVSSGSYRDEPQMTLVARSLKFDPAGMIPHVRCPLLAVFGAADELVPVERSVAILAERLPSLHRGAHGIAVLPGADHMLCVETPQPGVSRLRQLAPAFLPLLEDFLRRAAPAV